MKQAVMILGVLLCITLAGCAFLEGIAPSSLDEQGNAVPGTHKLTDTAQALSENLGPWGSSAVAIPLIIWNFVEIVRGKKNEKGLIATVKAIKQAKEDPEIKKAWETIKGYLANAHSVAGVDSTIKKILAKL